MNFTLRMLPLVGLLLAALPSLAQQLPMSSLYHQNRFMINPAAAGHDDALMAQINFRNQWAGIEGSPLTGWLNVHSPIGKNTNVGGALVYDRTAFISTFNVQLAYAHNIRLVKEHYLSLGVSAGVHSVQFDMTDAVVENPTDIILANGNVNSTTIAVDAGIRYHWKGLEIGAAAPNVIGNAGQIRASDNAFNYDVARHFRFYGTYDIMIKSINISPMGLVRWMPDAPISWDAAVRIGYKRIVWGSFMWRAETGPVAGIGFKVADKFSFSYAYDFTLNGLNTSPWSNEVAVAFHLDGFKKKFKKIDERLDQMEESNHQLMERVDSLQMALTAKMDSLQNDVNTIRDEDLKRIQDDIDRLTREIEELENRKIDSTQLKGLLQLLTPKTDETGQITYESQALQSGYYVVIESFRSADNAKRGVELWSEKGRNAIIVYDDERKWYYLYSQRFATDKEARKEMKATRKADVPDAWVHKYRISD